MSAPKVQTLDELFAEEESILVRRARERREAQEAHLKTPEGIAEQERYLDEVRQRREAEHAKGVRLGWWTEDGEPIEQPEETDDEDEDETGTEDDDQPID